MRPAAKFLVHLVQDTAHPLKARAALAELCVLQGRLTEAERLIGDRRDHSDVVLPLARLHLARGEYEEAIGIAGIGVRHMGDDRVRAARLLGIVVQAQLTLGDSTGQPGDLAIIQSLADRTCAPRPARLVKPQLSRSAHPCREGGHYRGGSGLDGALAAQSRNYRGFDRNGLAYRSREIQQ